MKPSIVPLLSVFLLVFIFASCDLFDNGQKVKGDEGEQKNNMEVYSDQAQNVILSIWSSAVKQNLSAGRTSVADSVEIDSLIEVCGLRASMDLSKVRPILTVNFTSFRCEYNTIIRQGQVKLELLRGTGIDQKNSVAKFTFTDFKVTDLETGKYVIFNGSKIITNLSGGALPNLAANQPELVHKVRSLDFRIFYSGSSGDIIKNTARLMKFSKLDVGNNYEMITFADTTIHGIANVADWGTLRNGKTFYHIIEKPIFYESCSKRCKYVKGTRIQRTIGGREITTIFGVDKNGMKEQNCAAFGKLVYYFDAKGDSIATVVKYK